MSGAGRAAPGGRAGSRPPRRPCACGAGSRPGCGPAQGLSAGSVVQRISRLRCASTSSCRAWRSRVRVDGRLVAVVAHEVGVAQHLAQREAQPAQGVAHHLQAALQLGMDHVGGPLPLEVPHALARGRAGHDGQAGRGPARVRHHEAGRGLVGQGHHQGPRPIEAGVVEDLGVGGVAEEHVEPARLQLLDLAGVGFHDESRHAESPQHVHHVLSHAAAAHHHHVVAPLGQRRRGVVAPQAWPRGERGGRARRAPRRGRAAGCRVMEKRAPARSMPYCSPEKKPSFTPAWPRMNENSPIWARPAATTRPVRRLGQEQAEAAARARPCPGRPAR